MLNGNDGSNHHQTCIKKDTISFDTSRRPIVNAGVPAKFSGQDTEGASLEVFSLKQLPTECKAKIGRGAIGIQNDLNTDSDSDQAKKRVLVRISLNEESHTQV